LRKKNVFKMWFITLFIFGIVSVHVPLVYATAVVFISPTTKTVDVGETFPLEINITGVTNLYGFEFKLYWNRTLMNCTGYTETPPAAWGTNWDGSGVGITWNYNATHGRFWRAVSARAPAVVFTGSVKLYTLTFEALTLDGPSKVSLNPGGTYPYPAKLSDPAAMPIACTQVPSQVTVIPEFPAYLITPLFMIITLVSILMAKVVRTRRSRGFTAK